MNRKRTESSVLRPYRFLQKIVVFLALNLIVTAVATATATKEPYIEIPALGRAAHLGYLYDERTDQFFDLSIFKNKIGNESITETRIPYKTSAGSVTNTYEQKFKLLNLKGSAAVNILSGIVTALGSSSIIYDEREHSREVSGTFLLSQKTVVQSLQIFYEGLKDSYDMELLNIVKATHIVTGVTWGANFAVCFSSDDDSEDAHSSGIKSPQEIKRELNTEFEKIKVGTNLPPILENEKSRYLMSIKFDISPTDSNSLPITGTKTYAHVREALNSASELLQHTNGGKGVPLKFTLTPLSVFRKYFKLDTELEIKNEISAHALNERTLKEYIVIFDSLYRSKLRLNDIERKLALNSNCVSDKTRENLIERKRSILAGENSLKSVLQVALIEARSGAGGSGSALLLDLAKYFRENNDYNTETETESAAKFEIFNLPLHRAEFCQNLDKLYGNIEYFGSQGNSYLNFKIFSNRNKHIYVLFKKSQFENDNPVEYEQNLNAFLDDLYKPSNKLFIVDCDFNFTQCSTVNQTVIREIVGGRFTKNEDVLKFIKMVNNSTAARAGAGAGTLSFKEPIAISGNIIDSNLHGMNTNKIHIKFHENSRNIDLSIQAKPVGKSNRWFHNPILDTPSGAGDPFVYLHTDGFYYMTFTDFENFDKIFVYKSKILSDWRMAERSMVYEVPADFQIIIAPKIQFVQGNWYIYFSMEFKENWLNRRMYVIQAENRKNPTGRYSEAIRLSSLKPEEDLCSAHGTVMKYGGNRLYFLYAGHLDADTYRRRIFIAPMSSPSSLSGPRVALREPGLPWDFEGVWSPQVVQHGNRTNLVFTTFADGVTFLGLMGIDGSKDPLVAENWWHDKDGRAFWQNQLQGVWDPGYAAFTKSLDLTEDWMVYDAWAEKENQGNKAKRSIRLEKITWNLDGTPNFPRPNGYDVAQPVPGGELKNLL